MSDIAIPGFSSDSNTAKQIENLLKAKNIPLEKLEIKQEEYSNLKSVWQDLTVTLSKLSDSSKKLYGFENPFNDKNVNSSNDKILTAESERSAIDENVDFTVNKIATSDKFVSNILNKDTKISKGSYRFTIGEKDTVLKFRGGDLEEFVKKLNKKNPDILKASLIKNSKNTQVLLIESLKTGKDNSLIFKDDSIAMGLEFGLIEENTVENSQVIVNDFISSKGEVTKSKYAIKLLPKSEASFRIDTSLNESDIVEITTELLYTPQNQENLSPLDDLKNPSVTLENITINNEIGGKLDRFSQDNSTENKTILDMNIVSVTGDKYNLKLPPITNNNDEKQILTFSGEEIKSLESINIFNKNTEKTLLIHSVNIKKDAARGEYIPVKPVTTAENAAITMNGMDIEREKNTIDDLVDGTTLYLHSADPEEKVSLTVDFDTEYAKDQILDFVYNYNQSLQKILILTNNDSAIISEIDFADDTQKEKAEEIQGLLKGDRTLQSIKQNLINAVTNIYPEEEGGYSLLKSIGISTNASGSTGFDVSRLRGYIEANLEDLDSALTNNIYGVKNLFGNDTNNDFIIDTGVAKIVDDLIKPYTRAGGTIATRVSTINNQIKRNDKDISDYKDDLISYEETIRRKYGQMDATINTLNSSMQSIENLTNSGDN